MDNRYYLRCFMRNKIVKDSLEIKLDSYYGLEEEYEELKDKVKYDGGKFLENDRKDNEIIILRRENSALKKEIDKLENKNKKLEDKNKIFENTNQEYEKKILELENTIAYLNKKISRSEKEIKEKVNEINLLSHNFTKYNSSSNLGGMNSENSLVKLDNNNINKGNYNKNNNKKIIQNIINFNNNNNKINFYSQKENICSLEQHKNQKPINKILNIKNSNNLIYTYSKIVKRFNRNSLGKEYTYLKESRNNSISVLCKENDKNKSISINKKFNDKYDKYPSLIKSGNNIRNIKQILKLKSPNIYPLTEKNKGNIIQKYNQIKNN